MDQEDRDSSHGTESSRQGVAFIEGLVAAGVRDFVVSPGSRSTPVVLALAVRKDVRCRVILDERSAAFFALGLADRLHAPVGLVCTSGTAGANYLPAVVEANHRRVPLVLLTADRPAELRDCGAGQTIDQVGLYGKQVRWEVDANAPLGAVGEKYFSSLGARAVGEATAGVPGPVHINLPVREPFLPRYERPLAGEGSEDDGPLTAAPRVRGNASVDFDWRDLRTKGPGWIVAGPANPGDPSRWANRLFELSDYLGWPIFCDVTNPGRHSPGAGERVVTQYEGLLSADRLEREPGLAPRSILQVGPLPTAKSLRLWLESFEGFRWQWSEDPACLDPSRSGATWIPGSPADLSELPGDFGDDTYRGTWLHEERKAAERVASWLETVSERFEGKAHRRVAEAVSPDTQVFWSNSMPVRDAERFWFADRPHGPRVFSNRGASGIDGIVSTLAGLADKGPPTLGVVGDLAFLHDCGGLRSAAAIDGSLTLLVLDNGGGRIFGQLPIAREAEVFEKYFLTPQKVNPEALCAAHGLPFHRLEGTDRLVDLLRSEFEGTRVLWLTVDADGDGDRRKEWRALFEDPAS